MKNHFYWVKFFIIWFIVFGIIAVSFSFVLPTAEDGRISFDALHIAIIIAVPVFAAFILSNPNKYLQSLIQEDDSIFSEQPKDKKIYAQDLVDEAKSLTVEINTSSTVFDFVYSYTEFQKIVQELIYLNEKDGIYMYPSPKRELERVEENIGASINDFISRAVGEIWSSGEQWAIDVDFLLDEIENDDCLSRLLTRENKERISKLRKRAEYERKLSGLSLSGASSATAQSISPVDIEQILNDENEWRRIQRGLSLVECELEKIDAMDGHTFEMWCAKLLMKSGFTDVEVTKKSGDQGVDVLATMEGDVRYAVQCKCYSSDIGNKPIQEVYAGLAMYNCQVGSVMTNRYFTSGAKELATTTGVHLWDRDWIKSLLEELEADELPL